MVFVLVDFPTDPFSQRLVEASAHVLFCPPDAALFYADSAQVSPIALDLLNRTSKIYTCTSTLMHFKHTKIRNPTDITGS